MDSEEPFVYSGHENLLAMQHAHNYNRFLQKIIRRYGEGSATVIDFGAGVGALSEGVRGWAKHLICVEPDPKQMTILRVAGFEAIPDISSLPDTSIGYVFSVNVLEHIDKDTEVLAAIFRKLQPGGRLLIYVPALQWLFTSMDKEVGHVRRYSRTELNHKLSVAGYSVTHSVYVDSLGVLATLAYKWLGNKQGKLNVRALKVYDRVFFPLSRALDVFFGMWLGKNLLVVCEKL